MAAGLALLGCGGSKERAASTVSAADLAGRIPPPTAVPGVSTGHVRDLPTAQAFVDAFYSASDPAKRAAVNRLLDGGYAGGVVREQPGTSARGVSVLRTYVAKLRDDVAARNQANATIDEIRSTSTLPATEETVPGVPGARAAVLKLPGPAHPRVYLLVFTRGSYSYGFQALAPTASALPEEEIGAAARSAATGSPPGS